MDHREIYDIIGQYFVECNYEFRIIPAPYNEIEIMGICIENPNSNMKTIIMIKSKLGGLHLYAGLFRDFVINRKDYIPFSCDLNNPEAFNQFYSWFKSVATIAV